MPVLKSRLIIVNVKMSGSRQQIVELITSPITEFLQMTGDKQLA